MSAVCKYFLAGNCRYGDRCKFRHTYPSDENYYYDEHNYKPRQQNSKSYSGVSILRSSGNQAYSNSSNTSGNQNYNSNVHHNSPYTYNSNNQRAALPSQNPSDVLSIVLNEIEQLENLHQWQLTCFCPIKETSIAPGWIDHSPEELRWQIYQASKDGTFENCKLSIQQLYKEAQDRRHEFKYRDKGLVIIEAMLQNKREGNTFPSNAVSNGNYFQHTNSTAGINNMYPTPFGTVPQPAAPFESAFSNNVPQQMLLQESHDASRAFHDPAPTFSFSLNSNPVTNTMNNAAPATLPPTFQNDNRFTNNSTTLNGNLAVPSQTTANNTIFSNSTDLTENELLSFRANTFIFGQVPLKPPPKELCQ